MSKQKQVEIQQGSTHTQVKPVKQAMIMEETAVSPYPALQRAFADPSDITPNDAKVLQRTFGNQAVRRFVVQRKMTLGPVGDTYEQEADTVAKQVMQTINTPKASPVQRQEDEDELQMQPVDAMQASPIISTLQRQEEEEEELQMQPFSTSGGGEISSDIESGIQSARGSGQPLASHLQASMGQAFNADFSSVNIHTNSQSDQLNRSIQARAFTTGQDIFFRQGEYNPGNSAGQELIAHELTHTIQQGGGVQAQRKPINRPKSRLFPNVTITPRHAVQRLVSKEGMERLAGAPSKTAIKKNSTYVKILNKLDAYQKVDSDDTTGQKIVLEEIKTLITSWLSSHTTEITTTVDDQEVKYRKATKKSKMRKDMFIQSLQTEIEAELEGVSSEELMEKGIMTPSMGEEFYKQSSEQADIMDKEEVDGDNFKVSILASTEHPLYFEFAKKRLEIRSKHAFRDNKRIKKEAAEGVIDKENGKLGDNERKKKVDELLSKSGAVGHSWIKLVSQTGKGDPKEQSFGYYPLNVFSHPEVAVPGKVKYPDVHHDSDPNQRRLDFDVKKDEYQQAFSKVTTKMKSPGDYTLIDYNCTSFVKEIAESAGVSFPAKSFMRVPSTFATRLVGKAGREIMDPNSLYNTLSTDDEYKDTAYNPYAVKEKDEKDEELRREWLREHVTITLYGESTIKQTMTRRNIEMVLTGEDIIDAVESDGGKASDVLIEIYSEDGDFTFLVDYEGKNYKVYKSDYDDFIRGVENEVKTSSSSSVDQIEEDPKKDLPSGREILDQVELWKGDTVELLQELQPYTSELDDSFEPMDEVLPVGFTGLIGWTLNGWTEIEINQYPYYVRPAELYAAVVE